MLPMVAIAVLACVMGYYIKNKFFKDDEDKEEKEKNEQKKTADMRMPGPKANKPWLNQGMKLWVQGGWNYPDRNYPDSVGIIRTGFWVPIFRIIPTPLYIVFCCNFLKL